MKTGTPKTAFCWLLWLHAEGSGYLGCCMMVQNYLCVLQEHSSRCLPLRNM